VKVRNPRPLQILIKNFPYVLTACHARLRLFTTNNGMFR
jgi:hypothetical protein